MSDLLNAVGVPLNLFDAMRVTLPKHRPRLQGQRWAGRTQHDDKTGVAFDRLYHRYDLRSVTVQTGCHSPVERIASLLTSGAFIAAIVLHFLLAMTWVDTALDSHIESVSGRCS